MKNVNSSIIALAIGMAFSVGSMATTISKVEYKTGLGTISADYKDGRKACKAFTGNAYDICVAEVKGKEKIAKADLEYSYQPSAKTRYTALVAKADADYGVASERCDDASGNVRDVCLKEAKALRTTATAEAKLQLTTFNADTAADQTAAKAYHKANDKAAEAYNKADAKVMNAAKAATTEANVAQYAVAVEKCDAYADAAKELCE